jgi:hypothetical protein
MKILPQECQLHKLNSVEWKDDYERFGKGSKEATVVYVKELVQHCLEEQQTAVRVMGHRAHQPPHTKLDC